LRKENSDKIAVIGGSGRTGRQVVQQLLQSGYQIRLLMRDPDKLAIMDERIEVVKGDVRDSNSIHSLLEGCNAVISTLGQPKGEKAIFSTATNHIIATMDQYGIKRYITVAGISVNTPNDKKDFRCKMTSFFMKLIFPAIMSDKQRQLEIMMKSNIDWTLVRVPLIIESDSIGKVKVQLERSPGKSVTSADLAEFLIKQINDTKYFGKCPFATN
jgi:putative NADH-flavin reductase